MKKPVRKIAGAVAGLCLAAIFAAAAKDAWVISQLEKADPAGRPLTAGEIAMAYETYGDELDYNAVSLHKTPWHGDDARAKGNHIYLEGAAMHSADFSAIKSSDREKKILMHELYHVLKSQKGDAGFWERLPLKPARILNILLGTRIGYGFDVNSATPFADLNEEQQASMIEEYFRATQVFDRAGCAAPTPANAQVCADVRAEVAKFEVKLKPALPLPGARTLTPDPR